MRAATQAPEQRPTWATGSSPTRCSTSASTSSIHSSAKIRLGSPTRTGVLSPVMRRSNRMARVPRAASSRAASTWKRPGPTRCSAEPGCSTNTPAARRRSSSRTVSIANSCSGPNRVSRSTIGVPSGGGGDARPRARMRGVTGDRVARAAARRPSRRRSGSRRPGAPRARSPPRSTRHGRRSARRSSRRAAPATKRSTAGESRSARRTSARVSTATGASSTDSSHATASGCRASESRVRRSGSVAGSPTVRSKSDFWRRRNRWPESGGSHSTRPSRSASTRPGCGGPPPRRAAPRPRDPRARCARLPRIAG